MREKRKARESFATTTRIILPNETNTLANLMGGWLLNWMDINAAISAQRHSRRTVVTAAVNNVSFNKPVNLGDILTIESQVSRAFSSSMEVFLDVYVENPRTGKRTKCNEAIYTFVAVDQMGQSIDVPELVPETKIEKERYDGALRRRQLSLILAGRLSPREATELRALFEE